MSTIESTPVKAHAQTVNRFSATIFLAKDYRSQFSKETLGMFYGPMPVKTFHDKFLPVAGQIPDSVQDADFSDVPTGESVVEKQMYEPLANGMNEHCKPFWFMISADESGSGEEVKTRPDIGMVDPSRWSQSQVAPKRITRRSTTLLRSTVAPAPLRANGPYKWGLCELSCEVKRSSTSDAFEDGNNISALDKLTGGGSSNRGQLITYYKEQALRQHRTFIFQIFIFGSFARLLRWDRSGAVVTQKFDYKEQPQLLAEFLWRYGQLTRPEDRGWDTRATLSEADDASLFKTELEKLLQGGKPIMVSPGASKTVARTLKTASARRTLEGDYPTYTIRLSPSTNWDYQTTLIIRRPLYEPISPFGRATRGYLAYDQDQKEFRFLKDIWRIDHRYIKSDPVDHTNKPKRQYRSEDDFYTLMRNLNIPRAGLPTVYYAGDVKNEDGSVQKTQTNELPLDDPTFNEWRKASAPLRSHVHHHVLQELLCPLQTFSSSKELVGITRDVLKTLKAVKEEAGILHRDLSVGNVMFRINDSGEIEGVLNDWDNNGPEPSEKQEKRSVGVYRTGTWQFMAIELLAQPGARNQLRHDIESATLWVPLYMALRYMAHNHQEAQDDMDMFDLVELPRNAPTELIAFSRGGTAKKGFLANHDKNLKFESAPFDGLMQQLLYIYATYYAYQALPPGPDRDRHVGEQEPIVSNLDRFIEMLDKTYDSPDWPESETIEDRFPPRTANNKEMDRHRLVLESNVRSDPKLHSQGCSSTMTGTMGAMDRSRDAGAVADLPLRMPGTSGLTDSGIGSSPSRAKGKSRVTRPGPMNPPPASVAGPSTTVGRFSSSKRKGKQAKSLKRKGSSSDDFEASNKKRKSRR